MPFTYHTICTGTWSDVEGTTYTLTGKRLLASAPGSTFTIDIVIDGEVEPILEYGDHAGNTQGGELLKSRLEMVIIDEDRSLLDIIAAVDAPNELFFELSDSSTIWSGYLDTDLLNAALFSDLELTVYDIVLYCALADVKDVMTWQKSQADLSYHKIVEKAVFDDLQGLDIVYVIPWLAANWRLHGGTGNFVEELFLISSRLRPDLSNEVLLRQLLCYFDSRIWQSMDNKWRIMPRLAVGQEVLTSSDMLYAYNGTSVSVPGSHLAADQVTISASEIDADATYPVRVRRPGYIEAQQEHNDPSTHEFVRDGDCEYWESGEPVYWLHDNITQSTNSHAGTYAINVPQSTAYVRQGLAWVRKGDQIYIDVDYWVQRLKAASNVNWRLRIENLNTGQGDFYSEAGGTWGQTDAYISNNGGTSWENITYSLNEEIPCDGLLWIEFEDDNTAYDLDEVSVQLTKPAGGIINGLVSRFPRYNADDDEVGGAVESVMIDSFEYDTDGQSRILVESGDGTINEWAPSRWVDHNAAEHELLVGLAMQTRQTRLGASKNISGTIDGLLPPEKAITYAGTTYICGSGVQLLLFSKRTKGHWVEQVETL